MSGRSGFAIDRRGIVTMFFALALAFRLAMPTGFMPVASAQGVVISVCSAFGVAEAVIPFSPDKEQRDAPARGPGPCLFAASLGGGHDTPPEPRVPATRTLPAGPQPPGIVARAIVPRLAAPPPPALGPPATA
jgi:hypothetical protein